MPVKSGGTKPAEISVDFTGVEEKRGSTHVPPGDYIVKVKDYEHKFKKDDNADGGFDKTRPYIRWALEITQPKEFAGKTIYFTTSLVPASLFNLRNMLSDMGVKVPSSAVNVPLAKLVGREVGITVDDDEYNNKVKSEVQATFNPKDLGEETTEVDATDEEEEVTAAATTDDDEEIEDLDLEDL